MSTTRSTRSASSRRPFGDAGVGLIGSVAGVTAFLTLLLFAVQVTYDLYATSAVTSAAYDAVRVVAGADGMDARDEAEARARQVLGRYGDRVAFSWTFGADEVSLRVQAASPSFLPTVLRRPLGIDAVDRTVRARIERLR